MAAVIASLITALFFVGKGNIKLQKELSQTEIRCFYLEKELDIAKTENSSLEKTIAFQDGVRVARKTDTLYKQLLKQVSDKERITLMMNGKEENTNG